MAAQGGKVLTAVDFFGADGDGVDKFKAVALRALLDQKIEEELKQMRVEKDALQRENGALTTELKQLKESMAANIDDRERVLVFKSKRIEELLVKVKEYEAINTSLLQTINGSAELTDAGRNTRASNALLERGEPLFHAVETCKEHEFKRLWEDKKLHCAQLQQRIAANETLVREMHEFQRQKDERAAHLTELEALVVKTTVDKDEKIHFLERKLVFEHDRLNKEKDSEILAHQHDMEKQLTLQLDATTQRTIAENVRVQLELRFQSGQLEKLIKQIDATTAENRQATHEKQLVEEMNAMLSKKVKFYEQLFARMQQHDQAKSKDRPQRSSEDDGLASRASPTRRKPPLPLLSLDSGTGMQSAFALSTASASRSPSRGREDEEDSAGTAVGTPLELDVGSLDLLGDQLNSVASEFDSHMQRREFARKEVRAMLQYRDGRSTPLRHSGSPVRGDATTKASLKRRSKKKPMLATSEYSPATYASRGARRLRASPLTLDAFINEHATIPPRHASPRLPVLSTATSSPSQPHRPPPRIDSCSLWKATMTEQRAAPDQTERTALHTPERPLPLSARF